MELYNTTQVIDKMKTDIEIKYKCKVYIIDATNEFRICFNNTNYYMSIDIFQCHFNHNTYTQYDYQCLYNFICSKIEAQWREFLFNG